MKLLTFPEVLFDTQNWLFDMNARTAEKNKSGSTSSSTPDIDYFQVERGSSYITTSGVLVSKSESNAFQMKYAQSISNHYWMTSYCGWLPHNSANADQIKHSPLWDGICNSLTFSWKKYDDAVKDGRTNNRYRLNKLGMAFRRDDGSGYLKDLNVTSGGSNLFSFNSNSSASSGITTGTCTVAVPLSKRPFGMYFQLETEGSGARYPSGSYIKIWNLHFRSNKSDEAILSPYQAYSSASAPFPRTLWTT